MNMLLPKSISRNTAMKGDRLLLSHRGISFAIAHTAIGSDCICNLLYAVILERVGLLWLPHRGRRYISQC